MDDSIPLNDKCAEAFRRIRYAKRRGLPLPTNEEIRDLILNWPKQAPAKPKQPRLRLVWSRG